MTVDLRCPNCGSSASLPEGMTCADHRPRPWFYPSDWDQESYCVEDGCLNAASHRRLVGMFDDETGVVELVCCAHASSSSFEPLTWLTNTLTAVADIHTPIEEAGSKWCAECTTSWPCRTARLWGGA